MTKTSRANVIQIPQLRIVPTVFQVSLTFDSSITMTGITSNAAMRIGTSKRWAIRLLRSSIRPSFDAQCRVPTVLSVELSRVECKWLEASAAVLFGRPGAAASDLRRGELAAQQQMGADPRIERMHTLTHASTPTAETTASL